MGVVIIRYNNFAAVVYDGSYLFIEIRFMFTIKSHTKRKFLNVNLALAFIRENQNQLLNRMSLWNHVLSRVRWLDSGGCSGRVPIYPT